MARLIYLLLGTNLGNRQENLIQARASIAAKCGSLLKTSNIYETAAWGKTDQPAFLNQVIALETSLTPKNLLSCVLQIEQELGRVRSEKWGERIIDIDILYYEDTIHHSTDLVIPHPGIAERRFVLEPLSEIAPDFLHPIFLKTSLVLLAECKDELAVIKIPTN
jgi:2-amino-4-hydroxy-6-hydroxymethyldihydropteridine diphosphokinase